MILIGRDVLKVEYLCRNGECVDRQKVCDGRMDCEDNSDEQKCDLFSHKHRHSHHKQVIIGDFVH